MLKPCTFSIKFVFTCFFFGLPTRDVALIIGQNLLEAGYIFSVSEKDQIFREDSMYRPLLPLLHDDQSSADASTIPDTIEEEPERSDSSFSCDRSMNSNGSLMNLKNWDSQLMGSSHTDESNVDGKMASFDVEEEVLKALKTLSPESEQSPAEETDEDVENANVVRHHFEDLWIPHCQRLLGQLLASAGLGTHWGPVVTDLCTKIVQNVSPDVKNESDFMDIRK